jgi:structure-specific recognition protein 1
VRTTRPATAFFQYFNATRGELNDENPGMKLTDTAKLAGSRWKAMSADEKAPYEAVTLADKDRYLKEMEKYVPPAKTRVLARDHAKKLAKQEKRRQKKVKVRAHFFGR